MINIVNLTKEFVNDDIKVLALDNISFKMNETGLIGIVGESGGGKTTLLNCLCKIDNPTSGQINGINKADCSLVFQDYQLLDNLSVKDNLSLFTNKSNDEIHDVLHKVGLEGCINKTVNRLSGGQKQRVAIARALLLDTKYIFADEPTGNLDSKTSENIMEIFQSISKEKLVVMISHNKELIDKYADRIITLKDGTIISDETKNETIDKNDTQTTKSDREISFRSVLKLRKAATSKVNSSGVFNVIFTFLLLLTIFLGINIVSTSRGEILNTVAQKSNLNMIDFIIENVDKTNNYYIFDELEADIKEEIPSTTTAYLTQGYVSSLSDEYNGFYVNKIYVISSLEGKILDDNEIIFSYDLASKVKNIVDSSTPFDPGVDNTDLYYGKKVMLTNKEVTIKGFDYKKDYSQYSLENNMYHDMYKEYTSYLYCNENTFDALYIKKENNIFDCKSQFFNTVISIIEQEEFDLIKGNKPSEENEIVITKELAMSLFPNDELDNIIGKSFQIYSIYRGYTTSHDVFVSGISNVNATTSENYTNIYRYSRVNMSIKYSKIISIPASEMDNKKYDQLHKYELMDALFISDEISTAESLSLVIGYILLVVSIPLAVLLVVFQGVEARQVILSNRRTIGIMKSMSFSKKSMIKIFIVNTLIHNTIAAVIALILSPLLIALTNSILVTNELVSFSFLNLKAIIILLMFICLLIVSVLCVFIGIKNLDKKEDVDLVYER